MSTNSPFCPCCKSAGKSKQEYTSHYVKDQPGPHGIVVCPTLLSQECNYCHEKGHTPKFCPELMNRGKTKRVSSYRSAQATHEMSANQRRQVEREASIFHQREQSKQQQKLQSRRQCIDAILYEKRYWFDPLCREEEIKNCLFAQTLFRLSDEQLAHARGWVDGEERVRSTSRTLYNEADEQEALEEADREFEYYATCLTRPKLTRSKAVVVQ
ncbi:MAG: hypothetical protein CMB73_05510 [Euryarchaeota archaeon]|nr:hypothetical protein [Euryarchaeota archaeon]